VHGQHLGTQLVSQVADDLVPAGDPQRLSVHLSAVVHGRVLGELIGELVPEFPVHAAQVTVLELADLLEGVMVHGAILERVLVDGYSARVLATGGSIAL
jgi:hypothetical protein